MKYKVAGILIMMLGFILIDSVKITHDNSLIELIIEISFDAMGLSVLLFGNDLMERRGE